jgi:hypothetical protein
VAGLRRLFLDTARQGSKVTTNQVTTLDGTHGRQHGVEDVGINLEALSGRVRLAAEQTCISTDRLS